MIELSEDTKDRVHRLFPQERWPDVEDLLRRECGDNLPLVESAYIDLVERIRFAVLKLSEGNIDKLERHIKSAQQDWRDVLVAAGFANSLMAHKSWKP